MRRQLPACALAALVFAGTAAAGNGHGNGNGHANGSDANGVKPSATTQHDTSAPASSNRTKLYGNGKTAGQIATAAGYGSATLHGPGNSQPHKVLCGGHEVDVHALKAKGSKCGTAAPPAPKAAARVEVTVAAAATTTTAAPAPAPTPAPAPAPVTTAPAPAPTPAPTKTAAGVKGASVVVTKPKPKVHTVHTVRAAPRSGVLGATATITRHGGTLPFTGLSLWLFALAGAGLLTAGLALARGARA